MNQVYRAKWTVFWLACSRHSVNRVRRSDGGEQVKLHTGKTRGKKMGGEWGESKGMPVNILNKGLFRTVYWIPVYPLIGGLWHLLTLEHWWHWWGMRYGRERDICYRIMWTLKLLQTTQSSISCMSNLFVMSRKLILLESRSPRPGRFCNFSNRFWGELDFSTLSTNNQCNQRKSWLVNFHDHNHCTSRSHNEMPSSSDLEKHQQQP